MKANIFFGVQNISAEEFCISLIEFMAVVAV
jgi:hypothetical protein